jgi:hypothetical protein
MQKTLYKVTYYDENENIQKTYIIADTTIEIKEFFDKKNCEVHNIWEIAQQLDNDLGNSDLIILEVE